MEELIYDAIPAVAPYNDTRYRFTSNTLVTMDEKANDTKGLLVAKRLSQVRNNGISELAMVEVYYYDKYGRVILTVNRNYQGYFERTWNDYNFAGQLTQTRIHQFYSSTNYYILDTFFKYDHRGRLLQTDYQVDGNSGNLVPRTVISAMVYDEAGQLKSKYLHSQSGQAFLQKVDYRYNIRGWLTGINDPGLTGTESDQFGMNLYYNCSSSGTAGYFNGNIQGEKWGITSYLNQVNTYTYDKLNRITASKFGTANAFRTSYSYDTNGNLYKLTRRGSTGAYIDSISYGYKVYTNQLDYTEDYSGDAPGWDFPGTLTGSNHYQYDANGNMTRDDYKAVSVSYNSFNLPSEIDFGNNQKLNYYYDGSGRKLTKINTPGSYYPTNTEYRGQFVHQYSNGTGSLKYIITPEGRLRITGTNAAPVWAWEYDLKDHLGNTRVTFKPNATNNGVVRVEYANYFPFGMKMLSPYSSSSTNKYLYNSKEMQDDFGLNWYDYGARMYDAAIGRWHSVDPATDRYLNISPYVYCANNPIIYIDPTGMYIEEGSQKEWERRKRDVTSKKDYLQKRADRLTVKAETKGWSAEKFANKIGDKNERIASLNNSLSTMGTLESSSQGYSLSHTATGENGGVTLNTETKIIDIKFGSGNTGNFVHEVTHAGQFETGDVAFNSNTGASLAQDIYDEVAAYKAQYAFSPSSVYGLPSTSVANSFGAITSSWVQGLAGGTLYAPGGTANTGMGPININSTRQDFINAYPGNPDMEKLPTNFILKTSFTNIYYKK